MLLHLLIVLSNSQCNFLWPSHGSSQHIHGAVLPSAGAQWNYHAAVNALMMIYTYLPTYLPALVYSLHAQSSKICVFKAGEAPTGLLSGKFIYRTKRVKLLTFIC